VEWDYLNDRDLAPRVSYFSSRSVVTDHHHSHAVPFVYDALFSIFAFVLGACIGSFLKRLYLPDAAGNVGRRAETFILSELQIRDPVAS
jgi:hypothetical protein